MKVIIIGLGSIAKKHINALLEINPEIELFALKRNKEVEKGSIKHIYSFEEIKNISPDFIIISNPTNMHFDTLKRLSKYNYPLFIEKPLFHCRGEEELALVEFIDKKNSTYVACNLRFHKGLLKVKELIKNKRIEEVNVYCGSYLPDWRPDVDFRKVYSANKEQGGGVHIDLIHELDYIYWLFGEPKQTSKKFTSLSSLNISSYDYANYLWQYETFNVNVVLNYYRKKPKRTLEILTSKGTYLLDLLNNSIMFEDEVVYKESQEIIDLYEAQLNFFIEKAIRSKNTFNTIKEGYKILELCL